LIIGFLFGESAVGRKWRHVVNFSSPTSPASCTEISGLVMDPLLDFDAGELANKEAFPAKLFALLENGGAAIGWQPNGDAFSVFDSAKFADLLPLYFKHKKLSSFQRQLNLYGFRREKDSGSYSHPMFLRGRRDLLKEIKRAPNKATTSSAPSRGDKAPRVGAEDTDLFWEGNGSSSGSNTNTNNKRARVDTHHALPVPLHHPMSTAQHPRPQHVEFITKQQQFDMLQQHMQVQQNEYGIYGSNVGAGSDSGDDEYNDSGGGSSGRGGGGGGGAARIEVGDGLETFDFDEFLRKETRSGRDAATMRPPVPMHLSPAYVPFSVGVQPHMMRQLAESLGVAQVPNEHNLQQQLHSQTVQFQTRLKQEQQHKQQSQQPQLAPRGPYPAADKTAQANKNVVHSGSCSVSSDGGSGGGGGTVVTAGDSGSNSGSESGDLDGLRASSSSLSSNRGNDPLAEGFVSEPGAIAVEQRPQQHQNQQQQQYLNHQQHQLQQHQQQQQLQQPQQLPPMQSWLRDGTGGGGGEEGGASVAFAPMNGPDLSHTHGPRIVPIPVHASSSDEQQKQQQNPEAVASSGAQVKRTFSQQERQRSYHSLHQSISTVDLDLLRMLGSACPEEDAAVCRVPDAGSDWFPLNSDGNGSSSSSD